MEGERGDLLLERAYRWEREVPDKVYLTQPLGGGQVRDYTWRETMAEARRMAAHLVSLGLPRGSRIGVVSKNCGHVFISDLATFMAGQVFVLLYPTLAAATVRHVLDHCERLQFLVVVKEPWLIENGFLTPSTKIKRSVIEERYAPRVAEWYDAGRSVIREA